MAKTRAAITAVGAYLPTSVLDNKTLEQMVDTNDEWIVSRTGIKERRILKEPGKATATWPFRPLKIYLKSQVYQPKI